MAGFSEAISRKSSAERQKGQVHTGSPSWQGKEQTQKMCYFGTAFGLCAPVCLWLNSCIWEAGSALIPLKAQWLPNADLAGHTEVCFSAGVCGAAQSIWHCRPQSCQRHSFNTDAGWNLLPALKQLNQAPELWPLQWKARHPAHTWTPEFSNRRAKFYPLWSAKYVWRLLFTHIHSPQWQYDTSITSSLQPSLFPYSGPELRSSKSKITGIKSGCPFSWCPPKAGVLKASHMQGPTWYWEDARWKCSVHEAASSKMFFLLS